MASEDKDPDELIVAKGNRKLTTVNNAPRLGRGGPADVGDQMQDERELRYRRVIAGQTDCWGGQLTVSPNVATQLLELPRRRALAIWWMGDYNTTLRWTALTVSDAEELVTVWEPREGGSSIEVTATLGVRNKKRWQVQNENGLILVAVTELPEPEVRPPFVPGPPTPLGPVLGGIGAGR